MTISPKAQEMIDFWIDPRNIPFKGKLIELKSVDGGTTTPCMCAQGQTLFKNGYTVEQLMNMIQSYADRETAKILGISIPHSVLLRMINDGEEGAPQDVLSNPQKYLGPNTDQLLEFWWKLDTLSQDQWKTIQGRYEDFWYYQRYEWDRATHEAYEASNETIRSEFAANAAWDVYGYSAYYATMEHIGGVKNPVFLPMFDDL